MGLRDLFVVYACVIVCVCRPSHNAHAIYTHIYENNTQVTALIKTHGIPAALLNSTTTETLAKQIYRDIYGLRCVGSFLLCVAVCVGVCVCGL